MIVELFCVVAITLISYVFYKWATLNNDYFERRNVKYLKPMFLLGSTGDVILNKYTVIEFTQKMYQTFPDESICGMFDFRRPQYIVRDPEVIKQIAVKGFDHFENRTNFVDPDIDKFWGNSLIFLRGEKWRQMRATLSPAFTGSKMRQMFELVTECADDVVKHFLTKIENGERINVEMKDFFTRYTNDVIATCAFGLKINSFEQPTNEFYLNGKSIVDFNFKQVIIALIMLHLPGVAKKLKISFVDKKAGKLFRDTILDTMEVRKQNDIHRPDMINILMQVREGTLTHQADEKEKEEYDFATVEESEIGMNRSWNDDDIVAQCFTFFVGGFDTTSTLLMFTAHELAVNPDVQQKLYEEIVEMNAKLGGKRITYDALQKMKYLDQVISESLRKWPSLPDIDRECVKDYVYDDGNGLRFTIEKGTTIRISIYGIQHDPKYFPEPENFDPSRFSDENKHNIVPDTYFPFGIGPRNCIGSRFAVMEIKVILYSLLLNFSFELNENSQVPLKLQKNAFVLVTEKGVNLELKLRRR